MAQHRTTLYSWFVFVPRFLWLCVHSRHQYPHVTGCQQAYERLLLCPPFSCVTLVFLFTHALALSRVLRMHNRMNAHGCGASSLTCRMLQSASIERCISLHTTHNSQHNTRLSNHELQDTTRNPQPKTLLLTQHTAPHPQIATHHTPLTNEHSF